MCGSSDYEAPTYVPDPSPPSVAESSKAVIDSRDNERRRRINNTGRRATLLTGGQGSTGTTAGKTLLGQ